MYGIPCMLQLSHVRHYIWQHGLWSCALSFYYAWILVLTNRNDLAKWNAKTQKIVTMAAYHYHCSTLIGWPMNGLTRRDLRISSEDLARRMVTGSGFACKSAENNYFDLKRFSVTDATKVGRIRQPIESRDEAEMHKKSAENAAA